MKAIISTDSQEVRTPLLFQGTPNFVRKFALNVCAPDEAVAILRRSAIAIYRYCQEAGIYDPTIVRLGNGKGNDLLIQRKLLESVGISPKYVLVDYEASRNEQSAMLNSRYSNDLYYETDLLQPLSTSKLYLAHKRKVDIIDCQQVLHEIRSEDCGGSTARMHALVGECYQLLTEGGLMLIDDVNIVDDDSGMLVEFALSDIFTNAFRLFTDALGVTESVDVLGGNRFKSTTRLLSIFMYKIVFVLDENDRQTRELKEIHKDMTKAAWNDLLESCGFVPFETHLVSPPLKLKRLFQENIVLPDNANGYPFSIQIYSRKPIKKTGATA